MSEYECEKLFRERNFARLKWASIKLLKQDEDNECGLTGLAYAYWSRTEYEYKVFLIAEKIHKMYPDNYHSYNVEAMCHLREKDFEKALECCDEGLKIHDYFWLRINRIEALICLDRIGEAFEFYNSSDIPNYTFTKALINCGRLSEISRYNPDFSKDELMDYCFGKAKYVWNRRDLYGYFQKRQAQNKDDELFLTYELYEYGDLSKYQELLDAAEKIHNFYPYNYHAYNVEAMALLDNGEFEKALECCDTGLAIRDYIPLRVNRTEALICLDRIDEAFEYWKSSEIPDYDFTEALVHCEKYSMLSQYAGDLSRDEQVELLLNRCRYLHHKSFGAYYDKKQQKIINVCDEIFKISPDDEVALGYKILALRNLVEDEEALECVNRAIDLYPDNFRFYLQKAIILYESLDDDIDEALKNCRKALSLEANDDYVRFQLCMILNKKAREFVYSEDYFEAIDCYEEIMSIDFNNDERLKAMFTVDSLVKKHSLEYTPGRNYLETLKSNRKVYDILTNDIGQYDSEYVEGCRQFKDYVSFEDYLRDVVICMVEMYPEGDEQSIKERIKYYVDDFRFAFRFEEPAYDYAAERVSFFLKLDEIMERSKRMHDEENL